VTTSPSQSGSELPEVDIGRCPLKGDGRAINDEAVTPEAGAKDRERAPQGIARVRPIRLWPEERRERLSARRAAHHGEVREERDRLAGVEGDRTVAHGDLDRAQEPDRKAGRSKPHRRNDTG
jgi:hypothetical protein